MKRTDILFCKMKNQDFNQEIAIIILNKAYIDQEVKNKLLQLHENSSWAWYKDRKYNGLHELIYHMTFYWSTMNFINVFENYLTKDQIQYIKEIPSPVINLDLELKEDFNNLNIGVFIFNTISVYDIDEDIFFSFTIEVLKYILDKLEFNKCLDFINSKPLIEHSLVKLEHEIFTCLTSKNTYHTYPYSVGLITDHTLKRVWFNVLNQALSLAKYFNTDVKIFIKQLINFTKQ